MVKHLLFANIKYNYTVFDMSLRNKLFQLISGKCQRGIHPLHKCSMVDRYHYPGLTILKNLQCFLWICMHRIMNHAVQLVLLE